MIPLKLMGGGIILGVGISASLLGTRREKRKLAVLDGWIDLLSSVRTGIDCYLMPLDEILKQLSSTRSPLPISDTSTLQSLLLKTQNSLGEEENKLLTSFVREIGSGYREEQIRQCNYYIDRLRELRKKRASELMPRVRVLLALCLCSSLGATILLW